MSPVIPETRGRDSSPEHAPLIDKVRALKINGETSYPYSRNGQAAVIYEAKRSGNNYVTRKVGSVLRVWRIKP